MRKQHADSSEGEGFDFEDDNFDTSSSDGVEMIDTWQSVVLGPEAKRSDFERVSKCLSSVMHYLTMFSTHLGTEECQPKD
jgi:hypothetical protein